MNRWVAGARVRTLPAAVAPVLVGTGLAVGDGRFIAWRALAAMAVALAVQVGANYANDYSDGVRGTDDVRVGPVRLVASRLATPTEVKVAAWLSFAVAGVVGLVLAAFAGWWLIAVGAAAVCAAWLYTGGPRPYGYAGLGEAFVFVFFGLVATMGTAYVQEERMTALMLIVAVPVGLLAAALLVANNLRDIPSDAATGKITLAVKLGDPRTRVLYAGLLAVAFACLVLIAALGRPWGLVALVALPFVFAPLDKVRAGALGPRLIAVLRETGRLQLVFGALLAAGLCRG